MAALAVAQPLRPVLSPNCRGEISGQVEGVGGRLFVIGGQIWPVNSGQCQRG